MTTLIHLTERKELLTRDGVLKITEKLRKKTIVGYSYTDEKDMQLYMIAYTGLSNSDIRLIKTFFPSMVHIGRSLGVHKFDSKCVYIQESITVTCTGAFGEHVRTSTEMHIFFSREHLKLMKFFGMYDTRKVAI